MTGSADDGAVVMPVHRLRNRLGSIVRKLVSVLGVLLALFLLLTFAGALTPDGPQPADAGELQLVTRELGIAHQPGYPLYTVVAHLFGRATAPLYPIGWGVSLLPAIVEAPFNIAIGFPLNPSYPDPWLWSLGFLNALLALGTLALVYLAGRDLGHSRWAGVAAAAALCFTPTFLAQTLVTNIRLPTAFMTALLLWLALRWLHREASDRGRWDVDWGLVAVAVAFGLAVGHHLSLFVMALPLGAAILVHRPEVIRDRRTLAAAAVGLALSQLPVLYLPLRDQPGTLFAPGTLRTARGLWEWVTAAGFRGDMLYLRNATDLLDRLAVFWNILVIQFGLLLATALAGAFWLARRDRPAAVLLVGSAGLIGLAAMTYRAPQTMEYLLPMYVVMALLIGAAAGALANWRPPLGKRVLALALVGLLFARGQLPITAIGAQSQMRTAPLAALQCAPDQATILASWHDAMPLMYQQKYGAVALDLAGDSVASFPIIRPDVRIQYVYPEGSEPIGETWLRRLAEMQTPAVITNRSREILDGDLALWPLGGTPYYATQIQPSGYYGTHRSHWCGLQSHGTQSFGNLVRLDGTLNEWQRSWTSDQTGGVAYVMGFEAIRPITETLTVFAQLIDEQTGQVWGQDDESVLAKRWNTEGGVGLRVDLTPFRGALPGLLLIDIGVYRSTPDGPERLIADHGAETIGSLNSMWFPELALPTPAPGEIPFGRAMTLIDHRTRRDGDELVVDLTWRADPWASRSDYTVSVQAHGDTWTAQDDGTPALGAIPTLKWLPGMVIRDRHRIQLPADLPADAPYRVTVGVYDAFSLEPLPVTDGELVRQGQGQAVEIDRR